MLEQLGLPITQWRHNCDACISLGECGKYDLYICLPSGSEGSLIARYGNEAPEYSSHLVSIVKRETTKTMSNHPLWQALDRATKKGLIK